MTQQFDFQNISAKDGSIEFPKYAPLDMLKG